MGMLPDKLKVRMFQEINKSNNHEISKSITQEINQSILDKKK